MEMNEYIVVVCEYPGSLLGLHDRWVQSVFMLF